MAFICSPVNFGMRIPSGCVEPSVFAAMSKVDLGEVVLIPTWVWAKENSEKMLKAKEKIILECIIIYVVNNFCKKTAKKFSAVISSLYDIYYFLIKAFSSAICAFSSSICFCCSIVCRYNSSIFSKD